MTIFREYDIRGSADKELTNSVAWALGYALAPLAQKHGEQNIYVGQDVRLSSPRLANALATGLQQAGLKVRLLPPGSTPLLYFAAHESVPGFPTQSGIMVTGSHNPPEDNGFKMVIGGATLFGEEIQKLGSVVEPMISKAPAQMESHFEIFDRSSDYLNFFERTLKMKRQIRVVIDAGNGAAGVISEKAYRLLGCDVIPIFCEPDGLFPNHHPDPMLLMAMAIASEP